MYPSEHKQIHEILEKMGELSKESQKLDVLLDDVNISEAEKDRMSKRQYKIQNEMKGLSVQKDFIEDNAKKRDI